MVEREDNLAAEIPMALSIPIGEVIHSWREFRGWSLTELANRAGLTKGYISQLENNKIKRPNDQHLAKLAGALGIEVWDIIARRMPTERDTENGDQSGKPGAIDVPFSEGAFHFSQPDQLEDAIIEELREVLYTPGLSHEERAEYIELIRSFVAWLKFRIGEHSGER